MPRKRGIRHDIFLSQEEELVVRSNMAQLGINNFSNYCRRMLIEGKISQYNLDESKNITRNMAMIGNNINQIARKVNVNDEASQENIKELLTEWQKFKRHYSEMMKKFIGKSKYI